MGRGFPAVAVPVLWLFAAFLAGPGFAPVEAQRPGGREADDPVSELVSRLTLDEYKTTLKGLTQFGDRRQGTKRNRDAVDWIEATLQDFGCTTTERIHYQYPPAGAQPRRSFATPGPRPQPPPPKQNTWVI